MVRINLNCTVWIESAYSNSDSHFNYNVNRALALEIMRIAYNSSID